MGVRGELFSTKVSLQNRTYFFNVKENRLGDLYLNIVESKNRDEGGFERQSVILFAEDLREFLQGFDESLRVLEKAAREKRRGGGSPGYERSPAPRGDSRSHEEKSDAFAGSRRGRPSPRWEDGGEGKGEGRHKSRDRYAAPDEYGRTGEGGRAPRRNTGSFTGEKSSAPRRDEKSGRERPYKEKGGTFAPKKRVVVKKK